MICCKNCCRREISASEEKLLASVWWFSHPLGLAANDVQDNEKVMSENVVKVLVDQASRGQMLVLSEEQARTQFPNLTIASLGAQRKDNPNGVVSARVQTVSPSTNALACAIKNKPILADFKRFMREKAKGGLPTFALTADVKEAHRQIPVAACDWHFLGCQVRTFAVASASYCWSRVDSGLGRLSQYLLGDRAQTWHMLVADPSTFSQEARTTARHCSFFILCATAGVPLSWNKTAGGDIIAWVGFELLHKSYQLGISQHRAECTISHDLTTFTCPRLKRPRASDVRFGSIGIRNSFPSFCTSSFASIHGIQYAESRRMYRSSYRIFRVRSV